jgi:hypothetical protein
MEHTIDKKGYLYKETPPKLKLSIDLQIHFPFAAIPLSSIISLTKMQSAQAPLLSRELIMGGQQNYIKGSKERYIKIIKTSPINRIEINEIE